MRRKYVWLVTVSFLLFSCKKDTNMNDPAPAPKLAVLLKDIVIPNLPAPYYHFEYTATGQFAFASFASDLTRYDFIYNGDKISEMRNNIIVNKDRLQYSYDSEGRVSFIQYTDSTGAFFAESFFTYDGPRLVKAERFHKREPGPGTVVDRVMEMAYNADGNLLQLTDHRPAMNGQSETTVVDRFEQYDNKINVDGFSRLHPDFFEHLFILPGVQLQKNNPGKEIRTGDGTNYEVNYSYTYNANDAPLKRTGDLVITNGANAGQRFQTSSIYTYY
jgi:hypothetical protein